MHGRDDLVQRTQCFIAQWSVLLNKGLVRSDNLFVGDEAKTGLESKIVANTLNCDARRQETRHDNMLSILQNSSLHESVCFDHSPLRKLPRVNSSFLSPACENNVC